MLQQFLRKDRKSELHSLIRFLSRFNQDFLNRNRKIQIHHPTPIYVLRKGHNQKNT